MQQARVIRYCETRYYLTALNPYPVKMNFDYTKDFRDRLRRAQQWNKGNSLIYSLR